MQILVTRLSAKPGPKIPWLCGIYSEIITDCEGAKLMPMRMRNYRKAASYHSHSETVCRRALPCEWVTRRTLSICAKLLFIYWARNGAGEKR